MKPLKSHIQDLRDMAQMLTEQANELERFSNTFTSMFGEAVSLPLIPQPEIKKVKHVEIEVSKTSRVMSAEEKVSLKEEIEQIPKLEFTKERRAILANKYQCSLTQIQALMRPSEYYQNLNKSKKQKQSLRSTTSDEVLKTP